MMGIREWRSYGWVALSLGLVACHQPLGEHAAPSQVLVKVNDAEITVHQLNYVLSQQPTQDSATKQRVLDQLVDQELMVQRATDLKLDRDPSVLQAIEFSKRQILAQAMAARELGKLTEPNQTQVEDFYQKNPLLFSARKIYTFDVFTLSTDSIKPALQAALNASKSASDTQAILNDADVKFTLTKEPRPAEQLPLGSLPKINALSTGDILEIKQGDSMVLLQLHSVEAAAVNLQDATPMIKTYLENANNQLVMQNKYDAIKKGAKIEYLQRFDHATNEAPAPVAANTNQSDIQDHINAGVKGLHQ